MPAFSQYQDTDGNSPESQSRNNFRDPVTDAESHVKEREKRFQKWRIGLCEIKERDLAFQYQERAIYIVRILDLDIGPENPYDSRDCQKKDYSGLEELIHGAQYTRNYFQSR